MHGCRCPVWHLHQLRIIRMGSTSDVQSWTLLVLLPCVCEQISQRLHRAICNRVGGSVDRASQTDEVSIELSVPPADARGRSAETDARSAAVPCAALSCRI